MLATRPRCELCGPQDQIFSDGRIALGGTPLNVFCVSAFGSYSQLTWTLLFLPLMFIQRGLSLSSLPAYICSGFQAMVGVTSSGFEAIAPALFVAANLCFNVVAITSLRSVGAATMALVMTAAVPATALAFTQRLPVLGPGSPLPPAYVPGLCVVLAGMLLYNAPAFRRSFTAGGFAGSR